MHKLIIDAGHGGMLFGEYLTPGKRSPGKEHHCDPGIFEGETNRDIARHLFERNRFAEMLTPGPIDIPIGKRVKAINAVADSRTLLVSIHCNAPKGSGWSKSRGHTVFHSRNASGRSERFAVLISENLIEHVPSIPSRGTKKANWSILKDTICPAVLVECGFMTNRDEAELLASQFTQESIASAINKAFDQFDREYSFL